MQQDSPPGWDEARVKAITDYYDHQSDEDAAAEARSAFAEALHHRGIATSTDLVLAVIDYLDTRLEIREAQAALVEADEVGTIPWDQVRRELAL